MGHDTHLLNQVTIKAKRTKYKEILAFEQSVRAYYDIPKELDRMRDEGKFMDYFPWLMTTLNPNIQVKSKWKGDPPFITMKYKNHYILCVINGVLYSTFDRELFIDKNIDAIKSVMICDGTTASAGIDDDSAYHLSDESLKITWKLPDSLPLKKKLSKVI